VNESPRIDPAVCRTCGECCKYFEIGYEHDCDPLILSEIARFQMLSGIGKQITIREDANDPRALLLDEFMRIVEEVRPRWFVAENVTTVPKAAKQSVTQKAEALGYRVTSACLNAADYGAAQTRRRWIAIGVRDGASLAPITSTPARTVRQAFAGIRENWGVMQSSPGTLARLATATTDEWAAMNGEYRNMIRLQWDEPAPTVCNPKKVYMVHPGECRNISLAEAAALQGFPPGYVWHGNESAIAQMVANAMPAEMAAAIAGALPGATTPEAA